MSRYLDLFRALSEGEVSAASIEPIGPPTARRVDGAGSPDGWRRRYHNEADELAIRDGITLAVALCRAYSRLVAEWHLRHARPDPAHCAGCGELLAGPSVHQFETGEVVHLDPELGCWLRYGERWRAAAVAGLTEIGIPPPDGWGAEPRQYPDNEGV
jgi:hypothetical protein